MRIKQVNGFTLMEMMAVVAILGILAAMAVPSIHAKIVRAQIVEAAKLADIAKEPIALSWKVGKVFPADNAEAGLPVSNKIVNNFITELTVNDGAINMVFGNQASGSIKGKTLTMRPAVIEDAQIVPVAWVCGHAPGPANMVIKGDNRTSIPQQFLPGNCAEKPQK